MTRKFTVPENVDSLILALSEHSNFRSSRGSKHQPAKNGSGEIAGVPYAQPYRWNIKLRKNRE